MKQLFLITLSALLLGITACEKDEKLWPAPVVPAGVQTKVFGMGENYENQVWFEFATQKIELNRHDGWDIAFSADESHNIYVNGGKNGFFGVAKFPGADFNTFVSLDFKNTTWEFDNPTGDVDSLVFKDWCTYGGNGVFTGKNILYVFDLGDDTLGAKRYIKFKLLGREGGVYHINWGYLHDTIPEHDEFLRVNEKFNNIYYNFSLEKEVYNEPMERNNWDIVFTTYKKMIPDENGNPYPYVLRGVISNSKRVQVAEITGLAEFNDITLDMVKNVQYSKDADEIGYDWKLWNLTANKYTVDTKKLYLIKDSKGDVYKMKFVDFYDDLGRKGYPKMAWELLK